MASVFRRVRTSAIPDGARILETIKPIPKAAKVIAGVASWIDRNGIEVGGAVTPDGTRYIARQARWVDGNGVEHDSPVVPEGGRIVHGIDPNYSAKYRDGSGKWVRKSTGTSDKDSAQRIAKQWEADAKLRREGVIDDKQAKQATESKRSIAEQLDAYVAHLATKAGTEKHRNRVKMHINEFATYGKWKTIRDIDGDSVEKHAETMLKSGASTRTVQARLRSVKSFTRWLADRHKIHFDPLRGIKPPSPEADRRVVRRMLLPVEWRWLREATLGRESYGLTGGERVLIYETAIQTGLRCSELAGLTVGKAVLDGDTPHLICRAAGTKNRKAAKQYIDQTLAGEIRKHIEGRAGNQAVFDIPVWDTAPMIQDDLNAARSEWLKAGGDASNADFLSPVNSEGEVLDFHALRHTCGAWLAIASEHPKVIQTIMRHSTITLTMDTYGHLFPGSEAAAVVTLSKVMRDAAMVPNMVPKPESEEKPAGKKKLKTA
jgi:integrase